MAKHPKTKKGRKQDNEDSTAHYEDVHLQKEHMSDKTASAWAADIKVKSSFKLTNRHKDFFLTAISDDTKILFVDGPAGTAKTYVAVYAALQLLQNKKIEKILYLRSAVESADRSLGFLPGEKDEKFAPYMRPLLDKMHELLSIADAKKLVSAKLVEAEPTNFLRGGTLRNTAVIVDEGQNFSKNELKTILTRIGEGTRIFVIGDTKQSDIRNSGFYEIADRFDDDECYENGISGFTFTHEDIVRSEILKLIARKLDC